MRSSSHVSGGGGVPGALVGCIGTWLASPSLAQPEEACYWLGRRLRLAGRAAAARD